MSKANYNNLITKTFRDNAIRSVIMIDDDFVPYDELCVPGFAFDNLPANKQNGTKKAGSIHRFFQSKKIVCDVDKGDSHIDVEKIRKSDLVILDYHLEAQDPRKSLTLLKDLSITEHMNLVVVYTRENLEEVWSSVAACLHGSVDIDELLDSNKEAREYWDDKTEMSTTIPKEWKEIISPQDIHSYITTGTLTSATVAWFGRTMRAPGKIIAKVMCERAIADFNLLESKRSTVALIGENDEKKWMQTGNVFVVLHKKTVEENPEEPEAIWNSVEAALVAWDPSYYQLLISEMQNQLENEAISFAGNMANDSEGQAAWLYQIIKNRDASDRTQTIDQLFYRLTDEIQYKLSENESLRDILNQTFDSITQIFDENPADLFDFSAKHTKVQAKSSLKVDIGHAMNYTLCTRDFDGKFVTSGTVLFDKEDQSKWYLCVAPACETVPLQATGLLAKRLKPHRLMKVLVLEKVGLEDALARATESNHIFIKNSKQQRMAFSVLNSNTRQPVIDYALVKNHDSSSAEISERGVQVSFMALNDKNELEPKECTLIPASQLRDMYTARFQAIASHHTGRVGVDFIKF